MAGIRAKSSLLKMTSGTKMECQEDDAALKTILKNTEDHTVPEPAASSPRRPLPALIIVALMAIPVAVAVWVPGGLFFVGFFWGLLFAGCSVWLDVVAMRHQRVFDDPLVTADEARNPRSTPSPTSRPFTN
ncbi:hypothetical protein [uncultured Bifidobacterium sp.]|uniref:hypothetical protein n=1 Tax=uncultured Bifidobacterium sp. TaxID=165187 RepID=UPI00261718A2|nr:hypothetical protein [uncultured Bifidobacterium sp.]